MTSPLASLAALLVYVDYKLASPQFFRQVLDTGLEQFCLFVITIIGVLATNLLMGVALGIAAKLVLLTLRGVWLNNMFKINFSIQQFDNNTIVVELSDSALFSNFLPLKSALSELGYGKTIIFDF